MSGGNKTDDILTCPICFERMKSPRMLRTTCQHVFCLNCLACMVSKSLTEDEVLTVPEGPVMIKCPVCDRSYKSKLVSDIEQSIVHNNLLDREPTEATTQVPKCVCINAEDVIYECTICGKQYCKGCFKKKDSNDCKELQHCIAEVEDGEKFLCFEHKINLQYYCFKCQHPVCVDCLLKDHRGHENKTISAKGRDLRRHVMQCKSIADGNNKDLEDLKQDAENLKRNVEEDFIDYLEKAKNNMLGIVSYLFDKVKEDAPGQIEARKQKIDCDLRQLGCQLNADQTAAEINNLHELLKETDDLKILKFEGQILGRLTSCNEQERKVKSVQFSIGNMKKQKGLFEMSMNDIFNSICDWFPNLQGSYRTEPESFYQDHFKRYLVSLMTDHTGQRVKQARESNDGTNVRITKETHVHPLESVKDEKLGHVAAAKSLSNMTDGKQSSSSSNQQEIDQGGNSVRVRNPNSGSSGGAIPYTPPHARLGKKDSERAWSTNTLNEFPNEDTVSQEQRSKSSHAIDKVQQFSTQGSQKCQISQYNKGRGARISKAISSNDMREQRVPPANALQPRIPLNSSVSPPHNPLGLGSHQPRASPPYQPTFYHPSSSPTSTLVATYSTPQQTQSTMAQSTPNDATTSGSRGQRGKPVTIKDPKQGGKDVTDEILKRTYPNRK